MNAAKTPATCFTDQLLETLPETGTFLKNELSSVSTALAAIRAAVDPAFTDVNWYNRRSDVLKAVNSTPVQTRLGLIWGLTAVAELNSWDVDAMHFYGGAVMEQAEDVHYRRSR